MRVTRRNFLQSAAVSAGAVGALSHINPAFAQDTVVTPDMVRFTPDIEPLVRLIEDTARDRCIEVIAAQLKKGMTYQQFLAATFLAGIRNVNPQPPGFKFHCVFLAHSANYLSHQAREEERLLPLFWVLDVFKRSQEEDLRTGDFVLRDVQGTLPEGAKAEAEFVAAMEDWDEPRADRAVTALARTGDPKRVFDMLWAYGARDYRNIGHKAIFVANAWRTLETIGWQHAEPTLRSLVLGLLDFGKTEVVSDYALTDQAYPHSAALVEKFGNTMASGWDGANADDGATMALLAPLRDGRTEDACTLAAEMLSDGKCQAQAIWDAAHLLSAELMMRQPGIAGVHAVTSINGLRYAYHAADNPNTKLLMTLQGVGWMSQFRNHMKPVNDRDHRVTEMATEPIPTGSAEALEAIFATVSGDRDKAAGMAYAYAQAHGAESLFDAARGLVFLKAVEHHHLKWPASLFEDHYLVSPPYRPQLAATSMYYVRGSQDSNSPAVERAIAAMKSA